MKPDKKLWFLVFGALGVVYGDIGTGPLYAINQIFYGHGYQLNSELAILGPISMVIWALTLIVAVKYLALVLMADNDGEGGVFALYARLHHFKNNYIHWIKILLMLAAGLLIGEGIITPAISVLSAVEGLAVYSPHFDSEIIPITIGILTALFLFQKRGTHFLGKIFGIVASFWFLSIGILGVRAIMLAPSILRAFNPYWAISFFSGISIHQALIILGSVMLVITGGEALFLDMGHFGKKPIRLGWFLFVFPALLLSYLGQGAYLLSGNIIVNKNIFFSMVPKEFLFPMIILATMSTIMASQALISGAFSLTSQAIALGLFPRLKVVHTHEDHEGQIYVGLINWVLFLGTISLVFGFRSSNSLAAAYGLSVSAVMLVTTFSLMATSFLVWKWKLYKILIIFVPVGLIELTFLTSNSLKFFEGGFIPVSIGLFIFFIMRIWRWGRKATFQSYAESESITIKEVIKFKNQQDYCIDKNVVLLVPRPLRSLEDKAPALVQFFYNRYGLFPKNLFLVEVVHRKVPYVYGPRHESFVFYKDHNKGIVASTAVHFGFMEEPDLEQVLEDLALAHQIALPADPHKWLVHTAVEKFIPKKKMNFFIATRYHIFVLLRQIMSPVYSYYHLGQEVNLSVEIMPIKLG